jgi:hypothetical protein
MIRIKHPLYDLERERNVEEINSGEAQNESYIKTLKQSVVQKNYPANCLTFSSCMLEYRLLVSDKRFSACSVSTTSEGFPASPQGSLTDFSSGT